jgi:hypothetical protein
MDRSLASAIQRLGSAYSIMEHIAIEIGSFSGSFRRLLRAAAACFARNRKLPMRRHGTAAPIAA